MTSSTRARDELVFTNLEWPKVTPSQERSGGGRLSNFHCEWPHNSVAINVIASGENDNRNRCFHVRRTFLEVAAVGLGEREQALKNSF